MPKMKTSKSVLKRVKITARGKVLGFKPGRRHLLSTKSAKRRRQSRRPFKIIGAIAKTIKHALHKKIKSR